MNTATLFAPLSATATASPGSSRIPLHRGMASRALAVLLEISAAARRTWARWREERQRRAAYRALAQLDARLLEDLGLADRIPQRTSAWSELERTPW